MSAAAIIAKDAACVAGPPVEEPVVKVAKFLAQPELGFALPVAASQAPSQMKIKTVTVTLYRVSHVSFPYPLPAAF